jgi:predicted nucleic acid-binding protein
VSESFVVDNSVVMSWCFEDESNLYADGVLNLLQSKQAWVPSLWPLEVSNVLLVAERKKRIDSLISLQFLGLLSQLPIEQEQESTSLTFSEVLPIARQFQLSSYDASYLALALRKRIPLATLDKNLIRAAELSHVPLVQV